MLTISAFPEDISLLASLAPLTQPALLDNLPIRASTRSTMKQWRANPGDGFCGLHKQLRLKKHIQPDDKQKPDLGAIRRLIEEDLQPQAQLDTWHNDMPLPLIARSYLTHTLELLESGKKMADTEDYMPIEVIIQLLVHRYPDMVSLWTMDYGL